MNRLIDFFSPMGNFSFLHIERNQTKINFQRNAFKITVKFQFEDQKVCRWKKKTFVNTESEVLFTIKCSL